MKKSYFLIGIVVILIAVLGCVYLSYLISETPCETTIEVYVDSPITLDVFVNEIKTHPYFEGYDNDTLTWLESLNQNYVVFSSNNSYYIMSQSDADRLPIEYATDVSITDICSCNIVNQKALGNNLRNVVLVENVQFKEQRIEYFDV